MKTNTKTQATHTQGPWYWRRSMMTERAAFVLGAENVKSNTTVLQVGQQPGGIVPSDADARLIAAAPTMYNFLASKADCGDIEAQSILNSINL